MVLARTFSFVVWKLLVYSFIGFGALIALSVLVPLFSVLIAVAVIGFLLWMPIYSLLSIDSGHAGDYWKSVLRVCRRTITFPLTAYRRVGRLFHHAKIECRRTTDGASLVLLEMISGAMLGCLLLFLRRPSFEPDGLPLLLGAVAGGVVGFAVGLAYRKKSDVDHETDTHLFEDTLCVRNSSPAIGK